MDTIIASVLGASFMFVSLAWPKLANHWLDWPNTDMPIGWLSRLGFGHVWACLVPILWLSDGTLAEWWYAYLGLLSGLLILSIGYYRDRRQTHRM